MSRRPPAPLLPGGGLAYAQFGEDRILAKLFRKIKATNRVAVEFGAWDGLMDSNTAFLRDRGWRVVLFDCAPNAARVIKARVTAENINDLFVRYRIPQQLDCLSIDIDGNDLWIWDACTYEPRVVLIEYNSKWAPDISKTIPYDPMRVWDGTDYYGASVRALWTLGARKGYALVAATPSNLIFVRADLAPRSLTPDVVPLPLYGKRADPLGRPWVEYP